MVAWLYYILQCPYYSKLSPNDFPQLVTLCLLLRRESFSSELRVLDPILVWTTCINRYKSVTIDLTFGFTGRSNCEEKIHISHQLRSGVHCAKYQRV